MTQHRQPDIQQLRKLSATLGRDPLQVQGAGGNTSIKLDDTLWIKASGTWLMHCEQNDQFVPVAISGLLDAVSTGDPSAEKAIDFVIQELNPSALRPSIETTLHAVMPQRIVVHVHCVDTIALASRRDAEQVLTSCLSDFNWLWVPYHRPGLPLSRYIESHRQATSNVLILGNHGLVVAADTFDEVTSLLARVRKALSQPVRQLQAANMQKLEQICKHSDYQPALHSQAHGLAMDAISLSIAAGGSLYPDHVIFLGDGLSIVDSSAAFAEATTNAENAATVLAVPDCGVLMHRDANPGQQAMARCLADVCARMQAASANYLNNDDTYELLNWEAEHYRQSLGVG